MTSSIVEVSPEATDSSLSRLCVQNEGIAASVFYRQRDRQNEVTIQGGA